jgi:aldose 1-epimerase
MKKYILHSTLVLVSIFLMATCKPKTEPAVTTESDSAQMVTINESPFGNLQDGSAVTLYTFRNAQGTEVKIINYGGIITSLKTVP